MILIIPADLETEIGKIPVERSQQVLYQGEIGRFQGMTIVERKVTLERYQPPVVHDKLWYRRFRCT